MVAKAKTDAEKVHLVVLLSRADHETLRILAVKARASNAQVIAGLLAAERERGAA